MIITVVVSLTLFFWAALSCYLLLISYRGLSQEKNKVKSKEEQRLEKSAEVLNSNPEILRIVREIIVLEKFPENETYKMRALILRAKLKICVSNPVIRRYLFDSVSNKKNN